MRHPLTTAWAESPLQLLGVLEHAALRGAAAEHPDGIAVIPRSGDVQLARTVDAAEAAGVPELARLGIDRPLLPVGRFRADGRWIIGDPFSGQVQARLARVEPSTLVLVDDGAITRHLAALLASGSPLLRPGAPAPALRRSLGATTTRTLLRLAAEGRLTVTTYLPPEEQAVQRLRGIGAIVQHHDFAWTRSAGQAAQGIPTAHRIVLGTAAVADGRRSVAEHLGWLREIARHGPLSYLPHRREPARVLRALAVERNVHLRPANLPVELALGGASRPLDIVSSPSSAIETLERVLAGSGSRIRLDPIPVLTP